MGIGSDFIAVLARLRLEGLVRRKAAVIDVGAQQLEASFFDAADALNRLGVLFGVSRPFVGIAAREGAIAHGSLRHLDAEAPPARDFWRWLGFSYAAIDIDGSPESLPLDLNYDDVPADSVGRFGVVTNFGTTEHVINQLNAFKVIHDLTAPKGLMIHQVPAQGMFNHGLVNYNFKFFWMLALSNGYKFAHAGYNQGAFYGMPENIVSWIDSLGGELSGAPSYGGADGTLTVILQKPLALPFVAPLDLPTDAQPDTALLKQRYWSMFEPDTIGRMVEDETAKLRPVATRALRGRTAKRRAAANGHAALSPRARLAGPEPVRDWEYAALTPEVFRETILSRGAVMLRSAVDPQALAETRVALDKVFATYAEVPADEFARHLASGDPEERDFWEQIRLGHIFDRTLKSIAGASYFDLLHQSGLWDFAAYAFPESEILESAVANCRRVSTGELQKLWDQPIEFHVDAQFFYDHQLSINFWTPLVACGVDAPGLQVVPIGVAETRAYLEYNPEGYRPAPTDFARTHKFRTGKMVPSALAENGLLAQAWAPHFRAGDVLAFTNFTLHATHVAPSMTQPRISVEARVDLPGYRFA